MICIKAPGPTTEKKNITMSESTARAIVVAGLSGGSGKSIISVGLTAAWVRAGRTVAPFKKGPDYIDPYWLSQATERSCYNLDFYTMQREEILGTVAKYSAEADITVIEGNKGLYDGLDLDGSNSNAALASLVKAPVILVLDARGMTRGIAPLILGYQAFDNDINIAIDSLKKAISNGPSSHFSTGIFLTFPG